MPLVVDVDGTLLSGDISAESLLASLRAAPMGTALGVLASLRHGRAAVKRWLAGPGAMDVTAIPVNGAVMEQIDAARRAGRPVYLASASDRLLVDQVASAYGPFDDVMASDGQQNLGGTNKAEVLCQRFGRGGFDYVGNAQTDLAVWAVARAAIVVGRPDGQLARKARAVTRVDTVIPPMGGVQALMRALRPHQWLKNLLVFTTPVAAHDITASTLAPTLLAFLVLCLLASSTYLINDLLDLPHDRAHPRKAARPIARGAVTIQSALTAAGVLGVAGLGLALTLLPAAFLGVAVVYVATTLLYSLVLKRIFVLDVFILAGLYALRVFAGAVVTATAISPWLLAFTILLFLALALVKRLTELRKLSPDPNSKAGGRGYSVRDADGVAHVAAATGVGAVVVLALYISSASVVGQYDAPNLLWVLCGGILFWFVRLMLLANRGELVDDPVLFAATDRVSLGLAAAAGAVFAYAA